VVAVLAIGWVDIGVVAVRVAHARLLGFAFACLRTSGLGP
jgi:hypothetical protein